MGAVSHQFYVRSAVGRKDSWREQASRNLGTGTMLRAAFAVTSARNRLGEVSAFSSYASSMAIFSSHAPSFSPSGDTVNCRCFYSPAILRYAYPGGGERIVVVDVLRRGAPKEEYVRPEQTSASGDRLSDSVAAITYQLAISQHLSVPTSLQCGFPSRESEVRQPAKGSKCIGAVRRCIVWGSFQPQPEFPDNHTRW